MTAQKPAAARQAFVQFGDDHRLGASRVGDERSLGTVRGRLPDINSADAWEKRMAEGVAAFARYRALAKSAQAQGALNNG